MALGYASGHSSELSLGIGRYLTPGPGTGGRLKSAAEDFLVEEVPLAFPKPQAEGKYTVAAVRAKNWETNRLIKEIGGRLRIGRNAIFFAGTKDKRAVTTQYLAVRAPLEEVRALAIKDVEILEAFRVDRAPKIGELVGNRFTIRARGFEAPLPEAEARSRATVEAILAYGGFPNYFGPQRFGVVRPITHVVGQRLIAGDLEGAFRAYVGNPLPDEPDAPRQARERFEREGDARAALSYYPSFMGFERTLLHEISERPGDYVGAFRALPRNLVSLFVFAEQSRLFNEIVTERMARGLPLNEPVVGDRVLALTPDGVPDRDRPVPVTERNLAKCVKQARAGKAFVAGLIPGPEATLAEGEMGEIERAVLDRERVDLVGFLAPELPEAASGGSVREVLAPLAACDVAPGADDAGEHLTFRFFLSRGTYATSFLREVLRTAPNQYA